MRYGEISGYRMIRDVAVISEDSFVQVSRLTVIGDNWAKWPLNLKRVHWLEDV